MKLSVIISIAILLLVGCKNKEHSKFIVDVKYYSTTVEFDRIDNFDTLVAWKWINDNQADHRQCYRIQDSALGIFMEDGMLPERAECIDQMTIKTPLGKDEIVEGYRAETIDEWLADKKSGYLHERPKDKIFKFDSLTIDGRKFGVFGIQRLFGPGTRDVHNLIIFMTNLNNNVLEFEFYTNLHPREEFYVRSVKMMKSSKFQNTTANTR